MLCLLVLGPPASRAAPLVPLMTEWKGEFFDQKQGGVFLVTQLRGWRPGTLPVNNLQMTVWNALTKQMLRLSGLPIEGGGFGDSAAQRRWKGPSGKYFIKEISLVDAAGVTRYWRDSATDRRDFVVKRQCLSNLGRLVLTPAGDSGLGVAVEPLASGFRDTGAKSDSSVAAVIDGFTGLIQDVIGGKKVLDGAAQDHARPGEMRAVVTFTRQVSMFYRLDLFRHNHHGRAVATTLDGFDAKLRQCYLDRLEWNDTLRGDVKFSLLISRESRTITKLKRSGGSLTDPKLTECMYHVLMQAQFPVAETMIGELTYTYDVR